jgi:predicted GNAT family N-acyltransferase
MNQEEVRIEQVRVEVVRRLRGEVLRPGLPTQLSIYPSDALPEAQHFAAWFNNKIIGVASIHPEPLRGFENEKAWRLRGMAVAVDFQGKGIGKLILHQCLHFIKQFNAEILWCNGRTNALGFYQSFGFVTLGDQFQVPHSGAHFVMILQIEKTKEDL